MINNFDWSVKYPTVDMDKTLIERIIECRGIEPEDLIKNYKDMYDPFLMNDMDIAVMKIDEARSLKKKILIYGDFDVDGTTATTVVYRFLRSLGIECDYYIPDRLVEGYGISEEGVDFIISNEYDLVITVDCGVAAINEIRTLMDLQIDVIVTDHHDCKETLPEATAIVDCQRPDNTYPFQYLAGVGVALKLCQALCDEWDLGDKWKEYIAYAALGTVADVVTLKDENRIIVTEGLKAIKTIDNLAIKNLLRISDKLEDINKLTSTDIAFYIAPKINASSRVGDVHTVMDLFLTEDPEEAFKLADELKVLNEERKVISQSILKEANLFLMENYDFRSTAPIVVYGDKWHKGVIGIVAAKLVEYYNKPTIVLSRNPETGEYRGSCRTFGDINIMDILNYASSEIAGYGGHAGAAGLTINGDHLEGFIKKVNEYATQTFTEDDFRRVELAEMVISTNDITLENAESLLKLEPYGEGNKEPYFVCEGLKTRQFKKIGKKAGSENAHLKATFADKDDNFKLFDGIGFFMSDYYDVLPSGAKTDVLFYLNVNEFNGRKSVQLMIKDIHFNHIFMDGTTAGESDLFHDDIITLEEIYEQSGLTQEDLLPVEEEYKAVFKAFRELVKEPNNELILTDLNLLTIILSTRTQMELNPFKLDRILEVMDEAGFIYYRKLLFEKLVITIPLKSKQRKKLTTTNIYKKNHNIC